MKSLIAIRHVPFEHLDTFETVASQQGFGIQYLEAGIHDPREMLDADLAVVLGGPIGAADEKDYPFLLDELKVIEQRIAADRPLLGICLGSQLIARVLGAKLHLGAADELGWLPIELTDAGKRSPLNALGENGVVFQWHSDTFDLPDGAVHLARTDACENQAFSYGKNTLAVQFHPEVSASNLETWYIGNSRALSERNDMTARQLREQAAQHVDGLKARSAKFLPAWMDSVGLIS